MAPTVDASPTLRRAAHGSERRFILCLFSIDITLYGLCDPPPSPLQPVEATTISIIFLTAVSRESNRDFPEPRHIQSRAAAGESLYLVSLGPLL